MIVPRRWRLPASIGVMALLAAFAAVTRMSMEAFPPVLPPAGEAVERSRVVDRYGRPLSLTYANRWNVHDRLPLHEIPPLLRQAFIEAEDRRFFRHGGVDWLARSHALVQNVRSGRGVRGASTISEQVVRMIHPRRRTAWSKWVEGFEAVQLEARFDKGEILEFYLNQVPYARQRRGIAQAARDYFDLKMTTFPTPPEAWIPRETWKPWRPNYCSMI